MTTLVIGASGATGRLLVEQLLTQGEKVRVIVRPGSHLPIPVRNPDNLAIIQASISDMSEAELAATVEGCSAVACCLGHNLSFKGIYGAPRRLVTESVRRISKITGAQNPDQPVKFVLMNTTGNKNRDIQEPTSFRHNLVIALLRLLLPPHVDNEQAADLLRSDIGQAHNTLEWVVVRPDSLIDEPAPTAYDLHPSPIRDPIFNSGTTSRINVAHFMAELIVNNTTWSKWKGRMPVIYNKD